MAEAVATCGTALTGQHARLLQRFAETAVLNFDQDEAGQKAARKSLEVLLEEGMRVRIVELPGGPRPRHLPQGRGGGGVPQAPRRGPRGRRVAHAPGGERVRPLAPPPARPRSSRRSCPALVRTANAVERQAWLARVVERGGLDAGAAREELRRALSGRTGRPSAVAEAATRRPAVPQGGGPAAGRAVAARARGAGGGGRRDRPRRADGRGPRGPALGAAPARGAGGGPAGREGDAAGGPRRARRGRGAADVGDRGRGRARRRASRPRTACASCGGSRSRRAWRRYRNGWPGTSGDAQEALLAEKTRLVRQMAGL